jgi:hypothetical protein
VIDDGKHRGASDVAVGAQPDEIPEYSIRVAENEFSADQVARKNAAETRAPVSR